MSPVSEQKYAPWGQCEYNVPALPPLDGGQCGYIVSNEIVLHPPHCVSDPCEMTKIRQVFFTTTLWIKVWCS